MATETDRRSTEERAQVNFEALRQNPYPGRGIVMGRSTEGLQIQVYWVMGRSENSRNRLLVVKDDVVKTVPFDESKVKDPSLIIYNAMRRVGGFHVVSNGDQTDTIAEYLENMHPASFRSALQTREFEPDAPNYTSRISGLMFMNDNYGDLSIIRRNAEGKSAHSFYTPNLTEIKGVGLCVHTYANDGDPIPQFEGNPYPVPLKGSVEEIASAYWDVLNAQNRVALVVKRIGPMHDQVQYAVRNVF